MWSRERPGVQSMSYTYCTCVTALRYDMPWQLNGILWHVLQQCHGMSWQYHETFDMALAWHCSKTCDGIAMACHGTIMELEEGNVPWHTAKAPWTCHGNAWQCHGHKRPVHGNAMNDHGQRHGRPKTSVVIPWQRHDHSRKYHGNAMVIHGHAVVAHGNVMVMPCCHWLPN